MSQKCIHNDKRSGRCKQSNSVYRAEILALEINWVDVWKKILLKYINVIKFEPIFYR